MNLTVGYFNDSYPPITDGVANVVKNYADRLWKKSSRVVVVTPSFPGYADREEFPVYRYPSVPLPLRPPYRLGIPHLDSDLHRKLRDIPFDLVHAHCPFSSGQLALRLARRRGIPLVATFHSKYYDDFKNGCKSDYIASLLTRYVVRFYENADYVWTVNEATAETLRGYGYKGKIEVVINGTDFAPVHDRKQTAAMAEQMLKLAPGSPVLLFVGQLIRPKNIYFLLEALFMLKKKRPGFTMVFAGDGNERENLRTLVKKLHMEEEIRFTGVVRDRLLLQSLFARADLFLFPSLYDTSALVVKEAAAAACPSLLIEGANAAEGIIDNYNGFLVKNDVTAYADKIGELLNDAPGCARVGKAAQESLCVGWDNIVDEVLIRYKKIIKDFKKNIQ